MPFFECREVFGKAGLTDGFGGYLMGGVGLHLSYIETWSKR